MIKENGPGTKNTRKEWDKGNSEQHMKTSLKGTISPAQNRLKVYGWIGLG